MGWKDVFKGKSKKKESSKREVTRRPMDKRVRQDEESRRASAGPSTQGNRLDQSHERHPQRRSASDASVGHDITPDEKYITGKPKGEARRKDIHDLTVPKEETRRTEKADDRRHQLVTSSEIKVRADPHSTERAGKQRVTFSEADDTGHNPLSKSYSDRQEQDRLVEHIMSGLPIEPETIMGKGVSNKPNSKTVKYEESSSQKLPGEQITDVKQPVAPAYITADQMKEEHYVYRMNNPRRGVALIFNIGEFLPVTGMKKRNGYEVDGELMKGTFTKLGFDVHYHVNQTSSQVHRKINQVADDFHGDADCFACVIMTHGNRSTNDLVFTKDGFLGLDFIVDRFNGEHCPTLAGKPKLFFVQACRGEKMDAGLELPFVDEDYDATDASAKSRKIPVEADILLSQATTPGYLSFRNSGRGSIYIRCLTKALSTHGFTEDILTVLTRVNAMVAFEFESNSSSQPEYSGKKQMPAFTSQLTKRLIFSAPPKYLK